MNSLPKYILSKSTFIKGLQCEKALYLYKHYYSLKDNISAQQQAIFDQGNAVGELAQDLFQGGVDASPSSYFKMQESVYKTKELIDAGETIIYEATFQYNEVLAALDILVQDEEGWKAYEVKSSTKVSETYIKDAAIQYYTIKNSGIDLKDIAIVHINNQYVKDGDIDVHKLFTIESVMDQVLELLPNIPNEVDRLKGVIKSNEIPNKDIGPHCSEPYDCDFKGTCWKHIPEYSIFNISRLNKDKKFNLYNQGVVSLDQIDLKTTKLNSNQLLQVQSEIEKTTHINHDEISKFIEGLKYPLYFLDFETMASAIPVYNNSRPYQQLVFQYSLHIQNKNGETVHHEYLAEPNPNKDPREAFVRQLIENCGSVGDILVYNIGFERGKLNDLISLYPEYSSEIKAMISRLKDLMLPFQKKWYYTPEMRGSYSIKAVLPALVPSLSYDNLDIKDGGSASTIFMQMVNGTYDGDYEKIKADLLAYCKLDTWAMVEILNRLKE
ncbi:DUF2779 domain-containing protein [Flavobacteriaceae bacterium]|nr:DUF2779 domain-containing protein [Flavobacteriaceae bacterium]